MLWAYANALNPGWCPEQKLSISDAPRAIMTKRPVFWQKLQHCYDVPTLTNDLRIVDHLSNDKMCLSLQ